MQGDSGAEDESEWRAEAGLFVRGVCREAGEVMRDRRIGLMAVLAMSSAAAPVISAFRDRKRKDMEPWERNGVPVTVDNGRRAEKSAAALAKAEAKRARKAAKRAGSDERKAK